MLQVARLAPSLLGEAVTPVVEFLHQQINDDGGARDRAGKSDLYYTVFLLDSLLAMHQEPRAHAVRPYLESFGDGEDLDLVHLTCLARCRAGLGNGSGARRLAKRIESHRCADGGYGTVYNSFLALGALQDLGMSPADPAGLARSIASSMLEDGAFTKQPGVPAGTTPTTAAALTVLRQLGAPVAQASSEWLLARARPEGGFQAAKDAPIPDVLSTATALHALAGSKISCAHLKEPTLDFLDTLWTGRSFCGSWADDTLDCEYTYYALLCLGHLSLA